MAERRGGHLLPYEEIEHAADYALRAYGHDLRELIQNAGHGMISLLVDPTALAPDYFAEIEADSETPEDLIVACLKELLYLEEEGRGIPVSFEVTQTDEQRMRAVCSVGLVPLEAARPHLRGTIKAVTYHDLHIARHDDIFSIVITFDT